jgi:mono/diheme cytochrome c family protein
MKRSRFRSLLYACAAVTSVLFIFISSGSQNGLIGSPSPNYAQSASTSLGKTMYEVKCARCHGLDGKGDGSAAGFLNPRPRDFTAGKYKLRSTESGSIPTDEDLISTIKTGLHGTAMPDWEPFLHGDSLKAVVEYMKSFSPRFANEQPKPVRIGLQIPSSSQSITAGKKVYEKLQCANCHGDDGMGENAVATDLIDDWGNAIKATNLTESWTFRGGATARDIYLRFRTGIDGTPMPSYIGSASEKEMWDMANYVVSLSRKPVWEMNEQEVKQFYSAQDKENKNNPIARGKYLITTNGCRNCHTPVNTDGKEIDELSLAGGQRWRLGPFGSYVTRNLTSDKKTGLGNWTDQEIKAALTRGIKKDGSRMLPFPMPWTSYSQFKDDDLNAIIAYLRTLPPVVNKIPEPEHLNLFAYMWGKFQMNILKKPMVAIGESGNAGSAQVSGKEK